MDFGAGLLIMFTIAFAWFAPQQIDDAKFRGDAVEQLNTELDVGIADCKYKAEVWIGDDGVSMMQLNVINTLNETLRRRINTYLTWQNAPLFNAKIANKSTPYWFRSDGVAQYGYLNNSREIMEYLRWCDVD